MFFKSLFVSALAALATAQSTTLTFTSVPNSVAAGQPVNIGYKATDPSSPVTILLRKGPSGNLQTVSTLTTSSTGGSYSWTPATSLVSGSDYALQITQGDQLNYFGPFTITGGSGMSSSSSMSSASMTSAPQSTASAYTSALGKATVTSTKNSSAVSTITYSGASAVGTGGASMSRNATMSSATLSTSSRAGASSTGGAGFQGSSSTGSSPASSTGGASGITTGGSAIALVFGAVAAVLFA